MDCPLLALASLYAALGGPWSLVAGVPNPVTASWRRVLNALGRLLGGAPAA